MEIPRSNKHDHGNRKTYSPILKSECEDETEGFEGPPSVLETSNNSTNDEHSCSSTFVKVPHEAQLHNELNPPEAFEIAKVCHTSRKVAVYAKKQNTGRAAIYMTANSLDERDCRRIYTLLSFPSLEH